MVLCNITKTVYFMKIETVLSTMNHGNCTCTCIYIFYKHVYMLIFVLPISEGTSVSRLGTCSLIFVTFGMDMVRFGWV